jgi:hypothetical protein
LTGAAWVALREKRSQVEMATGATPRGKILFNLI